MKYKSFVNEWYNSIYSYNFKRLNIILHDKNKSMNVLLNSYFNLKKLNKNNSKIELKQLIKKFFTNYLNKISFFNINEYNTNSLTKDKLKTWKLNKVSYIKWINRKNNMKTLKSLKRVFVSFPLIKHTNNNISILLFIFNKYRILLFNKMRKLNIILKKKRLNKKQNKIIFRNNLINLLNKNIIYKKKYIILKKSYLSSLYLNIFKYSNINLTNVKNIIFKVYNKKVKINIINMKYLYLDNNNLIQAVTRKLNDRKKKLLKTLKKTLKLIKLAKFLKPIELNNIKTTYLNSLINLDIKSIYYNIVGNLKNKHLIGIFLEAKGRLTRRMTASRAVYKLRYKGNMKNPYNINRSTKLNRGYIKPNLVINRNNSHNKNGSFGITSKINTY